MTSPFAITNEIMDGILTTAFEGGSNYWIDRAEIVDPAPTVPYEYISEVPSRGGTLMIFLANGDGYHLLNRTKLIKGIRRAAQEAHTTPRDFYENHDAGSADTALQFALFDEQIYA
jgi:hypothetical protein